MAGLRPRVLVIDDDDGNRQIFQLALEDAGYPTDVVADGAAALAYLRASPDPVVTLLDLMMPGVDGYQVLQTVAADARLATHHAYVVMSASALTTPTLEDLLAKLQAPFLRKPLDENDLLVAVAEAAERLA
jgi:CheY-like chemotaxis protein